MPPSITLPLPLPLRPKPKPILKSPSPCNAFGPHSGPPTLSTPKTAASKSAEPKKTTLMLSQFKQLDEHLTPYLHAKANAVRHLDAAIVAMLRRRCRAVKYNTQYNVAAERYFVACHRLEWVEKRLVVLLEEMIEEWLWRVRDAWTAGVVAIVSPCDSWRRQAAVTTPYTTIKNENKNGGGGGGGISKLSTLDQTKKPPKDIHSIWLRLGHHEQQRTFLGRQRAPARLSMEEWGVILGKDLDIG
ncbi:hypothetical protein BKA80DRAFT_299281 [Phyllosticta citrichinensis]